ncbi:uncharacterized protein LOC116304104 isoform X2 [Actinia tenebrosa]|nr:uncharacterized protein LOC116304104 isoform X2 [Actinia tenebrosa]
MEKLFNGITKELPSPVNTSKKKAKRCLCIRANTTNSKVLDQGNRVAIRLRILEQFKGKLSDLMKSPSCIQEETRSQGDINPSKSDHNEYHLEQAELFRELQKQGKLDSDSFDDNGYLLENNGKKCSIVSMCNKLDSITQEYIKEYEKEQKDPAKRRGQDREVAMRNGESLVKLFLPCIRIIMGRTSVDWAIANNIMSVNGYKQWKEHLWALMTFAALSVVIDALSKLPKYGSNSLFAFITSWSAGQPSNQPSNQPPDQRAT